MLKFGKNFIFTSQDRLWDLYVDSKIWIHKYKKRLPCVPPIIIDSQLIT